MTRALVTGGTGFAGRFLVQHLAAEGVDVHATSHGGHESAPGAATVHALDVRDATAVDALVDALRPDEIYHLAGVTRPASGDVAGFYDVNLGGARNVLEALRTRTPQARVLLVGSAYAYAPCTEPITEDWPIAPRNHYGASKAAAEMLGRAYAAEGLHVVLARPFNHSGPGQSPDFVLPTIVRQVRTAIADGRTSVTLQLGNLDPVRDISDVRDVVAGYTRAIRLGEPGEAYNLASGSGHSIRELVEIVRSACDVEVLIATDTSRVRAADVSTLVGSISKLQGLGWSPLIGLQATVMDMLVYDE
jgi:GDP-4-dehydro-6-deoxy-D-mannose reductase